MIHPLAEKIDKAIEEHLPAELGSALKKRVGMVDQLEKDVSGLENRLEELRGENKRLLERVTSLDQSLAQHQVLALREKAVQAREEKVTVFELKAELEAEKRVAAGYKEILGGLVRNIEYRNQVYSNVPVVIPGAPGSYSGGTVQQASGSSVEEKVVK